MIAELERVIEFSMKIAQRSRREKIRPKSREIIEKIKKGGGVHAVYGLRGTGKTTLLVTLLSELENSVFISSDFLVRFGIDLLDALEYLYEKGFRNFLLDEIHYVPDWGNAVKLFYDATGARVVVSGSSSIRVLWGLSELSRRAVFYELPPFSFREYLYFAHGVDINPVSIEDIINEAKRRELLSRLSPYFSSMRIFIDSYALPAAYFEKRDEVYWGLIERVVTYDLMNLKEIDINYRESAYRFLKFLATSEPGKASYSSIASSMGRSTKFVIELAQLLERAGLIFRIEPEGRGHKGLRGEHKLLFPLSIRSFLCRNYGVMPSPGALREDFFIHHSRNCTYVRDFGRRAPDYMCSGYIFEIGGKSKGKAQIKGMDNAFVVKDTLTPSKDELPLILFGLLY